MPQPSEEFEEEVEEKESYKEIEGPYEDEDHFYMAFYLNDSPLPFLVINNKLNYSVNNWQSVLLALNENIENKITIKLFNYNNYFEQISNMPIIRNIYYYNENTNEKIIEEIDIEEMNDGISLINGTFVISDPGFLSGPGGGKEDWPIEPGYELM